MRAIGWFAALAMVLGLVACGKAATPRAIPSYTPTYEQGVSFTFDADAGGSTTAPALRGRIHYRTV